MLCVICKQNTNPAASHKTCGPACSAELRRKRNREYQREYRKIEGVRADRLQWMRNKRATDEKYRAQEAQRQAERRAKALASRTRGTLAGLV